MKLYQTAFSIKSRSIFGLYPFALELTSIFIGTLGAGGYRDQQLALSGAVDYGDKHFTCFQFGYDWRRNNVDSVKALHGYSLEKRAYVKEKYKERFNQEVELEDIRFDIAAHSMAGLIVRYYLRYGPVDLPEDGSLPNLTWEGTEYIDKVVLIGPPNAGSLKSLNILVNGADFLPFFPKYEAAILNTMPGLFNCFRERDIERLSRKGTEKKRWTFLISTYGINTDGECSIRTRLKFCGLFAGS